MAETPHKAWREWLETRPASIQAIGRMIQPWKRYHLHHDICRLRSFNEDGTVTVSILLDDNPQPWFLGERDVFGVSPDQLHEVPEAE